MQEQWEKMTAIFNSRGGFNLLELNNGATAEEIAQLEQHTGLEFRRRSETFCLYTMARSRGMAVVSSLVSDCCR